MNNQELLQTKNKREEQGKEEEGKRSKAAAAGRQERKKKGEEKTKKKEERKGNPTAARCGKNARHPRLKSQTHVREIKNNFKKLPLRRSQKWVEAQKYVFAILEEIWA